GGGGAAEGDRHVLLDPTAVVGDGLELALEVGRDVAGEQLVAAQRLLRVRPFVRQRQDAAQAAGPLQQNFDRVDRVIRRAADDRAALDRLLGRRRTAAEQRAGRGIVREAV